MASSDPRKLMEKGDQLTKLSLSRWSADWRSATQLYEQAANGFRVAKNNEQAKIAFEKASKGQEMLSSPWDAAKHMESAAALAKELRNWREVADFYRKASELYNECGRSQPSSDALAKGARALEDAVPDDAIQLYTDACIMLEDDGKEQMAFDLYRAATNVYIKLEKYTDAATFLLRWGLAADKCNATNSQCKAYLSAIVVYLYANDFEQAEKCYNDCSQIDAFLRSDQNLCATKLISAYLEGDVEEIKRVAKSSTISNLDHVAIGVIENPRCPSDTPQDERKVGGSMYDHMSLSNLQMISIGSSELKMLLQQDQPVLLYNYTYALVFYHLMRAALLCKYLPEIKWLQIIKFARKLPTGDVNALKKADVDQDEEPLDENDLT